MILAAGTAHAYSVLTHQAIIDAAWDTSIKPLLVRRYPTATDAQLTEAHGYAYGGCILQDMGYYPFGSKFFSDLVHYVRSGDFIAALVRESQDLDEYAFALGALAHYAADNEGHPLAVNRAVALEYPKLRAEFGPEITYAEAKAAHLKVEFGFDVLQVARGNYAPKSYHDFIGFKVAKPVLERAFITTYGLDLGDVFASVDLALGTYRHTVSTLIPEATKVAWDLKKDEIVKATPGMTRKKFLYNLSRASYEKEWDGEYERPGIFARVLAFVFRLVPKVGPFRAVAFKPPTSETARLFEASFNKTLDLYRSLLAEERSRRLHLENRDFDTGEPTRPGEYPLADQTYALLVHKLASHQFESMNPDLRANILSFYSKGAPLATKRDPEKWAQLRAEIRLMESAGASGAERRQ